ncbi:N-acetylmuramoyl-L-alanine amidase [Deinococcus cavernae]|uniref:N-acetylmuramoyl-L-alanine amidase n=1 Tax=Deinococcus cavernae TaxID=2320857 RepID=A0A418V4L3_9DEIO|nr:N-acetylmuramoyl-L-alanine amidase [Deinococcus cavernae]RJF71034.1 N-acetylmuramoyl-L-alanine amidase [Deinococcus cavernae]
MNKFLLSFLLLTSFSVSAAQTATPTAPASILAPVSDEAIYVAYPGDKYTVAFDHVLIEGSVKPGATLSISGMPTLVGADGLFIEWVPLKEGENTLTLSSTLNGQTSTRELRITSTPPKTLTGAAQIVADSALPAVDRVAYLQPTNLEMRGVPVSFTGTAGGKATFRVGDLGPFPMVEGKAGQYAGTFMLPAQLAATPVTFSLIAPDGTTTSAGSKGKLSVTNSGPRVAEVTAAIAGRGIQAGTFVWRNGAGRNYVVYPRPGAQTVIVGEEGSTYTVQASSTLTLNAPKSTLTLKPEGTPLPRAIFTNINVKRGADFSAVQLLLPAKVPFTVEQQAGEQTSSLDLRLYHTIADVDYIVSDFPDGTVRDVRWWQDADGVARVHVDLKGQPWGYDATYDDQNMLTLRVKHAPKLDARSPLQGRTIVIDPGHGGTENGGAGPLRVPEKGIDLAVGLRVAALLKEKGANVILTRDSDATVPIYNRALLAEEKNADLLVSLHANALPDGVDPKTRRGAGVYYYHPQARELADSVLGSFLKTMPDVGNDGIHYQNLALTRPTTQLSILIEMAFLTDKANLRLMMSPTGQERFAQTIALGIEKFYRDAALKRK